MNLKKWICKAPGNGSGFATEYLPNWKLAGAELPDRGVGRLLNTGPLQIVGTLSYSWYLWHWPCLVLAKALYPAIAVWGKIGVATASLILAAITHIWSSGPYGRSVAAP